MTAMAAHPTPPASAPTSPAPTAATSAPPSLPAGTPLPASPLPHASSSTSTATTAATAPVAARARRSIAAARAARDGIATMVDNIRVGRPPLAPLERRRAALMGEEKEGSARGARSARSAGSVASKAGERADGESDRLKKQWAKGLVRRRQLEKERDITAAEMKRLREVLAGVEKEKREVFAVVVDLRETVDALLEVGDMEEVKALAKDLDEGVKAAEEVIKKMKNADLNVVATGPKSKGYKEVEVVTGNVSSLTLPRRHTWTGVDGVDADDTKSAYSCPSSIGDDPEAALAALADVADMLDARLGITKKRSATCTRAAESLARARKAIAVVGLENGPVLAAENSALMNAEGASGGMMDELEALRAENRELRGKVARVAGFASRVTAHAETVRKNAELQSQLDSAKKSIGRLVQERNAARRPGLSNGTTPVRSLYRGGRRGAGTGDAASSVLPISHEVSKTDSETIQKVLDWRRTHNMDEAAEKDKREALETGRMSLKKREPSISESGEGSLVITGSGWEDRLENTGLRDGGDEAATRVGGSAAERGRSVSRCSSSDSVTRARSLSGVKTEGGRSVLSLGAGDGFRESAANSVAGDEIHVVPRSNIFQSQAGPSKSGGLLGLLR